VQDSRKAAVTISTLALARAADLYSTWLEPADLSNEISPIVSVHGGGWGAPIVANALAVFLIAVGVCKRSDGVLASDRLPRNMDFRSFLRANFGRFTKSFPWYSYPSTTPHEVVPALLAFLGSVGAPSLIATSVVATSHNLLLSMYGPYRFGNGAWIGLGIYFATAIFGTLWFTLTFLRRQYQDYVRIGGAPLATSSQ